MVFLLDYQPGGIVFYLDVDAREVFVFEAEHYIFERAFDLSRVAYGMAVNALYLNLHYAVGRSKGIINPLVRLPTGP